MNKKCLVIGSGVAENIPPWLSEVYSITRLDLDPEVKPDVIGDAVKLPFDDESFAAIYCSHILEHIDPRVHDVLTEWLRVLIPGAEMIIRVPNLTYLAELILQNKENKGIYTAGRPITPMDMMYGLPTDLMSHKWNYSKETLASELLHRGVRKGFVFEYYCVGPYSRCEVQAICRKDGEKEGEYAGLGNIHLGDATYINLANV